MLRAISIFQIFSLVVLFISSAYANISEPKDDLYIESHRLTLDRDHNTALFKGEVVLYFEDIVLKSDKVSVIYKEGGDGRKVDRVTIPARVIAKKEKEVLIADRAEYLADSGILTFYGKVFAEIDGQIVKTGKLAYVTKLKKISEQ